MNAHARVLSAIQLEEPDRVPHFEMGVCNEILGRIYSKDTAFFDGHSEEVKAYVNLGMDGTMMEFGDIWGYGVPIKVLGDSLFVDGLGNLFSYSVRSLTPYKGAFYIGGYLSTPEEYAKFHNEFPRVEPEEWRARSIPSYKEALKVASDSFLIAPVSGGIFEEAITAIGHVNFFRLLHTNPRFIHEVLEYEKNRTVEFTEIFIDEGAEVVALIDDQCDKHGPYVSPQHWRELTFSHLSEVADVCHRRGAFLMLHCCGNVNPLLHGFIEAGVDAIQSLEPTAGITLGSVKEAGGNKICLVGNVDLNTLGLGTKYEVAQLIKESIAAAAPAGGYMLGATHAIYPLTSDLHKLTENFLTVIEVLKKYGSYPSQNC